MEFVLYPSTQKDKRYTVFVPKGNRLIKVDFGSRAHDNFTIHRDRERRRLYRIRHANDRIDDPYSPGFWAWHVLWNKTSLSDSMREAVALARRII